MKNLGCLAFAIISLLSSLVCAAEKHSMSRPFIGTQLRVVVFHDDRALVEKELQHAWELAQSLEAKLSDYQPSSELMQLCAKPIKQPHPVSKDLFTVLQLAQQISAKTQGAFDVTVGDLSKAWRKQELPKLHRKVSYRDLVLDEAEQTVLFRKKLQIDLGAIGKGYIADQLMLLLQQAGLNQSAVLIGGETVLGDPPPGKSGWTIAVEDPAKSLLGTLGLANCAVSTSGDSYQFYEVDGERLAHIFDARASSSMNDRLSVVTIAPSAAEADAWATALRVLGPAKAMPLASKHPRFEAMFIPFQKSPTSTLGFPKIQSHEHISK